MRLIFQFSKKAKGYKKAQYNECTVL